MKVTIHTFIQGERLPHLVPPGYREEIARRTRPLTEGMPATFITLYKTFWTDESARMRQLSGKNNR